MALRESDGPLVSPFGRIHLRTAVPTRRALGPLEAAPPAVAPRDIRMPGHQLSVLAEAHSPAVPPTAVIRRTMRAGGRARVQTLVKEPSTT